MGYTYGCGSNVWATYTSVPISIQGSREVGLWWTIIGYAAGRGQLASWITVYESDLAPMIDADSMPVDFSEIPQGAFKGKGDHFPELSAKSYVWWVEEFVHQHDCSNIVVLHWSGSVNMTLPNNHKGDGTTQINIAPVYGNIALLGEAGKVTAVSTHRFWTIKIAQGGLSVNIRGAA